MAGHRVYDTTRAIDYMQSLDDVAPERIGMMGISGGGLVAGFTAAVDERVRAAVVSGYVNTFEASILAMHHCVDNYIPGINRIAELPDLIGLIAPRALLVEAGIRDPIFPIEATNRACEQLRQIYNLLGKAESFDTDIFDGDHRISGAKAYDFLGKHLR